MNEDIALQKLADILPPPAPSGPGWLLIVTAIAVAVVAIFTIVWFVKKHRLHKSVLPAHEAQQRLTALRNAWQARTVSDREAAYRLATLLRLGLVLPQLTPQIRPAVVDDALTWNETLTRLHELRYRDQASFTLSPQFFDRAEQWLAAALREAR